VRSTIEIIFELFLQYYQGNETVIRRTQNVGDRLLSSGHYATNAIKTQMNRLNDEWLNLTRLLDKRTNILTASLQFHQKADEVKRIVFFSFWNSFFSFCIVSRSSANMETSLFVNWWSNSGGKHGTSRTITSTTFSSLRKYFENLRSSKRIIFFRDFRKFLCLLLQRFVTMAKQLSIQLHHLNNQQMIINLISVLELNIFSKLFKKYDDNSTFFSYLFLYSFRFSLIIDIWMRNGINVKRIYNNVWVLLRLQMMFNKFVLIVCFYNQF